MTAATDATTQAATRARTGQTKQRVITFFSYAILFALAALITLAAEGAIVAAALWLGGRLARSGAPNAG